MPFKYVFHSSRDTAKLGKALAKEIPGHNAQVGPDDEDVEHDSHAEGGPEQASVDICEIADNEVVKFEQAGKGTAALTLFIALTQPTVTKVIHLSAQRRL
jgi:hypothetical protein